MNMNMKDLGILTSGLQFYFQTCGESIDHYRIFFITDTYYKNNEINVKIVAVLQKFETRKWNFVGIYDRPETYSNGLDVKSICLKLLPSIDLILNGEYSTLEYNSDERKVALGVNSFLSLL